MTYKANRFTRVLMLAVSLVVINLPPLVQKANALECTVNVPPGGSCTTTTSCFLGVCHCVTVCYDPN